MVFGFIADVIGTVVGSILGLSAAVIAETLDIPIEMAKAAKCAGCQTYDEVRDFVRRNS